MKPTQVTELFAHIRKTFVSFFSILMFVALGVGIFLGINWSAPALQDAADAQFRTGALHHAQVNYPYGFTDSDIAELEAIEGVEAAEAVRQAFASFADGAGTHVVKFQTTGTAIDLLDVVEGRLPSREGEVALNVASSEELGLGIGDTLTISQDAPGTEKTPQLVCDTFTVTALVRSVEYLSLMKATYGYSPYSSGAVDALAWVAPASFDDGAYQSAYPVVNVVFAGMEGLGTFTDAYEQRAAEVTQRIEGVSSKLAELRYADLHGQAQTLVDEGQEKLEDGKAQLDDGKHQLADAEREIADAQEQIDSGQAELDAKRAEFETSRAEGKSKLQSARAELNDAQSRYDSAAKQYETARAEYTEKRAQYDKAVSAAEDAKVTLGDLAEEKASLDAKLANGTISQEEYGALLGKLVDRANETIRAYMQALKDAGKAWMKKALETLRSLPKVTAENFDDALAGARALIDGYRTIPIEVDGKTTTIDEVGHDLDDAEAKLDAAGAELASKKRELDDGWKQYYAGKAKYRKQVAEAQEAIANAESQLADARDQVEEGEQQIEEKKPQLDKAQTQLAEKETELDDADEQLAAMRPYNASVAGRAGNGGVMQVSTISDVTRNLALSMAALFVIVGLLVSYSAVSRIVHEQVVQIGTKKALGLRGREITTSFLAYSALAVLLGAVLGAATGFAVVERIISHTVGSMFTLGDYEPHFGWGLFAGITALELVLVLGATWLACRSVLRRQAIDLLRGEEPPRAKTRFYESWRMWNRLPLFTQTIVNNCMNDKRRVFSTIMGVAGATALIVCAITLNDDVMASYDTHYRDVYGFNAVGFAEDANAGDADAVERALQGQGAATAQVVRRSYAGTLEDGAQDVVRVVVPADVEAFSQLYHIEAVEGPAFDPDADAAWASRSIAEHMGAAVGDTITLEGADGAKHQVAIGGFYDFHLANHELVMGRAAYERAFDASYAPNAVLADTVDKTAAQVAEALVGTPGLASVVDDKADQRTNFDSFASISRTVVLIYLALATLMAIVVLLNLNVMFIEEKKRELIVLIINGFSIRDAKRYIYRDTIALTVIGILAGLVLGAVMGSLTVASVEPSTASFVKGVAWRAIAAGIAGSAVLAAVMMLVALRRISRFELTDINKF